VEGITGLGFALAVFNSTEPIVKQLPHLAYHIAIGMCERIDDDFMCVRESMMILCVCENR
jgi:hypothetical protein